MIYPRRRQNKYGARRTTVDGIRFDSAKEAKRYSELLLLEKAGAISKLEIQPTIKLTIAGVPIVYRSGRHARYRADFRYIENGTMVVEDTKSPATKTPAYKLKDAILLAMGIQVVEL
jgi:hypothetical protein